MSAKTKYAAFGAVVVAAVFAQLVSAQDKTAADCSKSPSARLISFVNDGWRRSSDGYLIFRFSLSVSITKNVTVSLSAVGDFRGEWELTDKSPQPLTIEVGSRFRQFPASPNKMTLAVITSCLETGSWTAPLKNTPLSGPVEVCPDWYIVDSRGSGEPKVILSPPGGAFAREFAALHPKDKIKLVKNPYPAAGGKWALFGAYVGVRFFGKYNDSVIEGSNWLAADVERELGLCPRTKVILTGYSQGAEVVGNVIERFDYGRLWAAVLFGDPEFNSLDGYRNRWSFSDYNQGRLGERFSLKDKVARFLSFCHAKDPVCQNLSIAATRRLGFKWHTNYEDLGEPEVAARYLSR